MWRAPAVLRRTSRRRAAVLLALAWLCLGAATDGATLFDPALRFRQIRTDHFVIYFHQGEEALARRLAAIAEETWLAWRTPAGLPPPARTHVVLADETDTSNGWATPIPYNTIVVTAAWPSGSDFIGNSTDWLRLVFTHEFTHIVHLGRSRGWARLVHGAFGRVPLAFPNLFLPAWEVEGLATYFESAITAEGRLYSGDFRAIERQGARNGRSFPMDRASGGLVAWPGGDAAYAYGLGFHAYLAERFGPDRLIAVAEKSAGRVPYTSSRVFKGMFGESLGALWKDYQRSLVGRAPGASADSMIRQLTHSGFVTQGPRFAPPACDACGAEIVYSVRSPHEFPALKVMPAAGGTPRTVTTRYLGSTSTVTKDAIIFDQHELRRNVGLYGDLYAVDRRSGRVRRLTSEARLLDPDLAPDGRTVVAVHEHRGARDLVTLVLDGSGYPGTAATIVSEPDTQFSTPRWSPDGRAVAVERHRLGASSEIVTIDVADGATRVVATGATRAVTPAWRPDGRALVAAIDSDGGPFNLFEFVLDADGIRRRQLTHTTGGATWPDVSADGSTLVFSGFTDRGFDLFAMPYPADEASPEVAAPPAARSPVSVAVPRNEPAATYRPWPTLLPRAWTPVLESDGDQVRMGVATGGADVLGYHAYAASATWRTNTPDALGLPARGAPDWDIAYAYDRWQPMLFASASSSTSFLTGASAPDNRPSTLRERSVEAGVFLPFRRVRRSQRLLFSGLRTTSTVTRLASDEVFHRVAARGAWAIGTARTYGYSISPERGVSAGVTAELAGPDAAGLTDTTTLTADFRAYAPGARRHHVLALRAAGGTSSVAGPQGLTRTFRLGGGSAAGDVLDFGRGAFSLLRGFEPDAFAGPHIAIVNAEYRLPLLRVERGIGTWPVFVRTVHATVFADAGHAWRDTFRTRDLKTAAGAEISADIVAGFALPFTLTVGVGRGHDGSGRVASRTTAYARIGRAF